MAALTDRERLIVRALYPISGCDDQMGMDDVAAIVEAVVRKILVMQAALSWISTHDVTSVAGARRTQVVASRALHNNLGPTDALR